MMRRVDRLGFRRAFLTEVDGEDHHAGKGKKLALPVLERFKPEAGGGGIVEHAHLGLPMRLLFRVVFLDAAPGMHDQGEEKESHEGRAQRV